MVSYTSCSAGNEAYYHSLGQNFFRDPTTMSTYYARWYHGKQQQPTNQHNPQSIDMFQQMQLYLKCGLCSAT